MLKISHVREISQVKGVPLEVIAFAERIVTALDCEYGEDRGPDKDGGYVVILTPKDSISALSGIGIDANRMCPEYTDIIPTTESVYIHAITLQNNEHSIHVLMPKDKAPGNLLD